MACLRLSNLLLSQENRQFGEFMWPNPVPILVKPEIREYLEMGLNLAAITKLVNPQLEKPVTYNTYRYFVQHEKDLLNAWQVQSASKSR